MLFCHDYDEREVAIFSHQIQSGYYDGNRSVPVECIVLEHFSALPQKEINSSTESCPQHKMFHYFLSYDSKQDSATTTVHRIFLIELLKE